jgi:hypothetical protein
MSAIIITGLVAVIVLLLVASAWLATRIADAVDRKVESILHEHDHEMIGGSPL